VTSQTVGREQEEELNELKGFSFLASWPNSSIFWPGQMAKFSVENTRKKFVDIFYFLASF